MRPVKMFSCTRQMVTVQQSQNKVSEIRPQDKRSCELLRSLGGDGTAARETDLTPSVTHGSMLVVTVISFETDVSIFIPKGGLKINL